VHRPVPNPASRPSAPHVGRKEPRLATPPQRRLTRKTSRGFEVVEFAEMIGEPLLPWQEYLVKHALELNPDGTYRFRTVLVLVARQNGKSSVKRIVSLWRLYMEGAKLILGTAQDVAQAREQWQMCIDTIRANPDLDAEVEQERRVNGDEWFKLSSGGRYKIAASNRRAGRGLSIDELTIDELREQRSWDAWSALSKTTMARANAQTWCMSNAGDDESVVLNQLRDAALSGRDPSIGLFEWSAPDGCELDDWKAIAQANPGLGHTISPQAIKSALGTDPPNVYRTEVLCQRVDQLDGAVDLGAWRACADPSGTIPRRDLVACFDVAPDGQHATLAAAAVMADGRARVEIVRAWKSTDAARDDLPGLLAELKPTAVAWYPAGPAAAVAPILRPLDGNVELKGLQVAEACQGLADLAQARQVIHPADPLLDAHISGAAKLPSGDGWRFTRRGGHVDAAYAAAGAVHVALTVPAVTPLRVRFV
jgi:Terminase large subunit, ATPase domain